MKYHMCATHSSQATLKEVTSMEHGRRFKRVTVTHIVKADLRSSLAALAGATPSSLRLVVSWFHLTMLDN